MDANARPCGHLGPYARIAQRDGVITGARDLGGVAEPRAIAAARPGGAAVLHLHDIARERHDENVAEVRMPGARKMRLAESGDRRVFVAVAGGVRVAFADHALDVGVGRQLHHPERPDRAGEGMPLPAGADERIDRSARARGGLGDRRQDQPQRGEDHGQAVQRSVRHSRIKARPPAAANIDGAEPPYLRQVGPAWGDRRQLTETEARGPARARAMASRSPDAISRSALYASAPR